jgi:hypothetical protein
MATLFHRRLGFPSLTKDGPNRIERRFRSVPAPTDRTAVADEDLLGRQENRRRSVSADLKSSALGQGLTPGAANKHRHLMLRMLQVLRRAPANLLIH